MFGLFGIPCVFDSVEAISLPGVLVAFKQLEITGEASAEYREMRKNGEYIWISNRMSLVRDDKGNMLYRYGNVRDITERKRAEEALRESEEKYRSLFNSMGEGFAVFEPIYGDDGKPCDLRYIEVNPAYERRVGLYRDQVVGKTAWEINPNIGQDMWDFFCKVAVTGEPGHIVTHTNLSNSWIELYGFVARRGQTAFIINDITERKRDEEALRESERRFSLIFEKSPVMMLLSKFDDGTIVNVNEQW